MTDQSAESLTQGPELPADTPSTTEKRVGWAELFFDLVFVFAVTETSTLLQHDHSWNGLLRALVVFVPVYWMWVGTSIQTNIRDMNRPGTRVALFAVGLVGFFMAIALPHAYEHRALLFAIAYWAGRCVLGAGLLRGAIKGVAPLATPFAVSMVLTGPMLVVGAFLHGDARELIWGIAALLDLSTPSVLQRRLRGMHYDAAHLAERFGLFVLIALGESVVAIGESAELPERFDAGVGGAVAAAFVLSCGLWWVYFAYAADAMRHALATARVQLDITRFVLSYGHVCFIGAIILVSVGMRTAVAAPTDALSWPVTGLLFGGTALYLAGFGYTRWAMFRLMSWTRLTAAVAVLIVLPAAPHVPALASLSGLAVVVAVLNLVELSRVEHTDWRARLLGRPAHP